MAQILINLWSALRLLLGLILSKIFNIVQLFIPIYAHTVPFPPRDGKRIDYFKTVVFFFDIALFGLVSALLFYDLLLIISFLFDVSFNIFSFFREHLPNLKTMYHTQGGFYSSLFSSLMSENVCYMVNHVTTSTSEAATSSHNTTVQIIHTDAGWSNSIRQIFIYGTGAFRLSLLRSGGTPGQRAFVIASTVLSDVASKAINNAVNDSSYVRNHIESWRHIWKDRNSIEIHVDKDANVMNKINDGLSNTSNKSNCNSIDTSASGDIGFDNNPVSPFSLNGQGSGIDDFSENLLNSVIKILQPVLEPVTVDYSQSMLAEQIYVISILLFILSVLIIFLLLAFMFNIIILTYSDKLMSLFTNKYIRWYIAFNKKIIGIEICFLGGSILYFMYMISYGIHFIATHPITID